MNINKRVLLSGYYGFDNSGDDAILKAIVKDLKMQDKDIDITVLSKDPEKTMENYNVNAVKRFNLKEVFNAIKSTSLLISGGGSLLQDVTSTRSLWYYLMIMYLSKFHKKKIMVYANGIGPINKKFNRNLAKNILNKVDLITLRDQDSKRYLEDMGVKNDKIFVTADPVFTLDPSKEERIKEIFTDEGIPLNRKYIGISIRKWKDTENLGDVISKVIDYLLDKYDIGIILIPMHHPEDLEISLNVQNRVEGKDCYTLEDKYSVEDIMGVIKGLDLIIAMRLHSLIYAATQEVPMVGIVYDPKVEGILKSFDIGYMCPADDLDFEDCIYNVDAVWENREEIRQRLKKQDEKFIEKALSNVRMALELLEAGD